MCADDLTQGPGIVKLGFVFGWRTRGTLLYMQSPPFQQFVRASIYNNHAGSRCESAVQAGAAYQLCHASTGRHVVLPYWKHYCTSVGMQLHQMGK